MSSTPGPTIRAQTPQLSPSESGVPAQKHDTFPQTYQVPEDGADRTGQASKEFTEENVLVQPKSPIAEEAVKESLSLDVGAERFNPEAFSKAEKSTSVNGSIGPSETAEAVAQDQDLVSELDGSASVKLLQALASQQKKSQSGEQDKNENMNQYSPNRITHPPSVTLTLFENWSNPNITWKTKFKSFTATLFINLFLPFMNGVMLGFGEIAAKEILGNFFGWGPSAHRYHKHSQRTHQLSSSFDHSSSSSLILSSKSKSTSNNSSPSSAEDQSNSS